MHASTTDADTDSSDHDLRVVRRALDELPAELRLPLTLRFEEGLSFANVGAALACAESTAHDRVSRALAALERRLRELGFGALAARLPERLANQPLAPVPAGVETALLGLGKSAVAGTIVWTRRLLATTAVGGAAFVAVMFATPRFDAGPPPIEVATADERTEHAGVDRPLLAETIGQDPSADVPSSTRTEVASPVHARMSASTDAPGAAPSVLGHAFIEGSVREVGGPLPAPISVVASTVAHGSKLPLHSVATRTDDFGRYRLRVPVTSLDGEAYRLRFDSREHHFVELEPRTLRVDATESIGETVLVRRPEYRSGAYRLDVSVVDPDGAPVGGARVELFAGAEPQFLPDFGRRVSEHSEVTDPAGRVTLTGRPFGTKRIVVSAPGGDLRVFDDVLTLETTTAVTRTIALRSGISLSGRVRCDDGKPLPTSFALLAHPVGERGAVVATMLSPEGRFELRGLDPVEHEVTFADGAFVPQMVRILPGAGALDLVVQRKPAATVGGLIHGYARFAVSGRPAALGVFDVDLRRIYDETLSAEDARRQALRPWIAQREAPSPTPVASPEFYFDGLEPGRYLVVCTLAGYATSIAGPFEIVDASTRRADVIVEIARGGTLRGRVLDAHGRPLADAMVAVAVDESSPTIDEDLVALEALRGSDAGYRIDHLMHVVRADAEGWFDFTELPPGVPLRLSANHAEWRAAGGGSLTIADESTRDDLVLRLTEPR